MNCRLRPKTLTLLLATLWFMCPTLGWTTDCPFRPLEGQQVAQIHFEGLVHTHPLVVRRSLLHHKDAVLSCSNWQEEQKALLGLDLFSKVDVVAASQDDGVHLTYAFLELRQFVLFPAMKSTDLNGFMLGGGGAALNLFGQDIRLDGYGRTSLAPLFNANEFMLWATSPWLGPWPLGWEMLLTGVDALNPGKSFHERSYAFELDVYQKSFHPFNFLFTADVIALLHDPHKKYFTPDPNTAIPLFLSDTGWDVVPKVGFALIWDGRDRMVNPISGQYLELRWSQFGGFLGGPADYQEYLFDYRGYFQLDPVHYLQFTSLGQYRPGTMGAYDLYHVGGTNSVRAYVMSPINYAQHEWISTLEYRFAAIPQQDFTFWDDNFYSGLHLVAGLDAGWLWRTDKGDPYLMSTAYLGAHILFPYVERIRVEFGVGELAAGPEHLIWGITVGFFEKAFMQRERIR